VRYSDVFGTIKGQHGDHLKAAEVREREREREKGEYCSLYSTLSIDIAKSSPPLLSPPFITGLLSSLQSCF
jgi:hypothetical protein